MKNKIIISKIIGQRIIKKNCFVAFCVTMCLMLSIFVALYSQNFLIKIAVVNNADIDTLINYPIFFVPVILTLLSLVSMIFLYLYLINEAQIAIKVLSFNGYNKKDICGGIILGFLIYVVVIFAATSLIYFFIEKTVLDSVELFSCDITYTITLMQYLWALLAALSMLFFMLAPTIIKLKNKNIR